jgi:hypothetical protein
MSAANSTGNAPASTGMFHSRYGGFPLFLCTYTFLDENGANTDDLDRVASVLVTALNGHRFRLRDTGDIWRFLAAVGRARCCEVPR